MSNLALLLVLAAPSAAPSAEVHSGINTVAALRCVLQESRSNEDISLLPLFLAAARGEPGTFVEIGANDGFQGSQTWLLEKCFGWSGVLIEALPQSFAQLQQTPRLRSRKVQHAVCQPGIGNITVTSVLGRCRGNCFTKVPCRPLASIMADSGFPRVNFLSLDVEGHEELALHTALKNGTHGVRFPFDVLLVEAERHTIAKNARVRRLLGDSGFSRLAVPHAAGSHNDLFARSRLGDPRLSWEQANAVATREQSWLFPLLTRLPRTSDSYRRILSPKAFAARVLQAFPLSLFEPLKEPTGSSL